AEFTSNFASKYGGAVSNFGTFTATGTTFRVNVASSGGAIQNAGSATINGCDFTSNAAYLSINRVVDGADFGGNGGAIFTSQTGGTTPSGGTIVFEGASTFNGNQAANAGGAIDYVSGTMTINGGMTFAKNVAEMVGGAFVAANKITFGDSVSTIDFNVNNTNKNSVGDIAAPSIIVGETTITASPLSNFQKTPSSGDAGYYAPTVAVTYNIPTRDIDDIKSNFFSGVDPVGRDLLDTFTKYSSTTVGSIKYADLADSFKTPPTSIKVEVDGGDAKTLNSDGSGDTIRGLATGTTHTVRYWDASSNDSVKFTANIYVISDTTSVKVSQFDLSDWAYVPYEGSTPPNNKLPIGVTIQIFSNNPVSEWTIDWGDNTSNTYSNYGFTCNVYHAYTKGEATTNRTLKLTLKDGNTTVLNGAEVSTIEVEAASNAVLDVDAEADSFANLDLVDELFGE
ncbi:MAG: hypothetical protein J6X44_12345, partial [Thermoguttaceae bacterium]|nr:hypothetical protein [Thermoguttaceae bacterium]